MFLYIVTAAVLLLLVRTYVLLSSPSPKRPKRMDGEKCALAVFLGSGGHTSEALALVSALDFSRYSPRVYIVSQGDVLSATKAVSLERSKTPSTGSDGQEDYRILTIPRARRVHQTVWTVLPTFVHSVSACAYLVTIEPLLKKGTRFADVLIMNGPGTCVTLYIAIMVNKLLGLSHPKIIYIESYARVRSLSLSGKILHHLVDRFVVQWPNLLSSSSGEYYGCLAQSHTDSQAPGTISLFALGTYKEIIIESDQKEYDVPRP